MFDWHLFNYTDFNKINLDWIMDCLKALWGGSTDQILSKKSDNDFDFEWVNKPELEPGDGLTEEIKQSLLQLARKVAYIDNQGETYYQDLYDALYNEAPPVTLVSIDAVYTQSGTVYDTDTLNSLKADLVVTATYSDSTTAVIPAADYTLSGTLTVGSSVITVSYGGKTDTFTVAVTENPAPPVTLVSIDAVYTQSGTVYDTDTLDSLKADLVVTATYSDSTTAIIPAADYTLTGTLTVGSSVITVSYGGKTDTFTVAVTNSLPAGYTRLQYVTANGLQYIDTGVDETQCTHAEYNFSISSQPKVNGNHILSSKNTYFPFLKGGVSSDPDWQTVIGSRLNDADGISDGSSAFSWNLNQIYHIEGYPENKIYIDNEYIFTIIPGSTALASNHYYMFTYGGNISSTTYRFHGNLYYAKMYDSNGSLLRDFVPCKNESNVVGLYDLITETFYHSGSGTELTGGGVA